MERREGSVEEDFIYGDGRVSEEGRPDKSRCESDPGDSRHDWLRNDAQNGPRQLRRHVEDPPRVPRVTLIKVSGNFAISYALNLNT